MNRSIPGRALFCAVITVFAFSCNSGNADKAGKDTAATTVAAPALLKDELFIQHKVLHYAKWKPLFDADAVNRKAAGLQDHIVARGVEDSNMVLVILFMDDAAKAKTMVTDPKLKETMQKAGVLGAPAISFIRRTDTDTTPTSISARVMIQHKVKDWAAWKKVFDADKPARVAAGLQDRMVGHEIDDDHMVTVVFVVTDEAKAKTMVASKELAEKMKTAGVEGVPNIFFYQVTEKK